MRVGIGDTDIVLPRDEKSTRRMCVAKIAYSFVHKYANVRWIAMHLQANVAALRSQRFLVLASVCTRAGVRLIVVVFAVFGVCERILAVRKSAISRFCVN